MAHESDLSPAFGDARFPFGQTVITRTALSTLPNEEVLSALGRHAQGDWGNLDPEDWQENEYSLANGHRLFSVYHTEAGTSIDYIFSQYYVISSIPFSLSAAARAPLYNGHEHLAAYPGAWKNA